MRFYGREAEIEELTRIRQLSFESSRFTVVTGRRRVGKTELMERAFGDGETPYLYLLVSQRAEKDLCALLQDDVARVLTRPLLGRAERFRGPFRAILEDSIETPLTLVIDEFQEFDKIDPAIFTDIQGVWDELHKRAHVNLVVCGSVNRLMNKIFFDDSQPLYGRNTGKVHLDPFPVELLKKILADHAPKYKPQDLLALWVLTGGVARYVELLMDAKAFTRTKMIATVFGLSSSYVDEGRIVLGQGVRARKRRLFLDPVGHCRGADLLRRDPQLRRRGSRRAPDQAGKRLFAHREDPAGLRGPDDAQLPVPHQRLLLPLLVPVRLQVPASAGAEAVRGNPGAGRAGLRPVLRVRPGALLQGQVLESHRYTRIAGWWDRKGENEIDLVCENELTGALDFYEVKRDRRRLQLADLQLKVAAFWRKHPDRQRTDCRIEGLSLEDL